MWRARVAAVWRWQCATVVALLFSCTLLTTAVAQPPPVAGEAGAEAEAGAPAVPAATESPAESSPAAVATDTALQPAVTPTSPPVATHTPRPRPTQPPPSLTAAPVATSPVPDTVPADTVAPPTDTPSATATRRPTRTSPPRFEAASATATALAAAPAAGVAGRGLPGPAPALEPPAWVALGGLLALLAAWVGARLARGRERVERRRARRTLATTMLIELRRMDAVLRKMVALDNPASFPSLDHPIMEAALRDLTLFETETAARIAQFHGALRGIQHDIDEYRDNPLRWAGRLGELNQTIKGRATAACRAVPELMKALAKEGGAPPPPLPEPTPPPADNTQLPPPPFGATESDDWTL